MVTNSTFEYGSGHLYITDAGGIYTLNITDSNFHRSWGQEAISYRVRNTPSNSMHVSRCNFTNNQQAIRCDTFLKLENSNFSNNGMDQRIYGGAVEAASYVNISNCYFFQNQAEGGGAVSMATITITDTVFDSNSALYGRAIGSVEVEATRCMFISNTADVRGGVYTNHYSYPRSVIFIECSFINNNVNTAGESGGVIKFGSYHPCTHGNIALTNSIYSATIQLPRVVFYMFLMLTLIM